MKSYATKQESKDIIYLEVNNLYGYASLKNIPISGFKWIDSNEFDLNKYTSNSWKVPFMLWKNYPLALDKIKIQKRNFA